MRPHRHRHVLEARHTLVRALSAMLVLVASAAVLFSFIEDWDFFRALYFVLITVTTVGYGDEGISTAGRWLAVLVMLGGIGGTTYSFALMVQVVLAHSKDWRWRMERRISKLQGHSIVVGYGSMGRALARELREAGRVVVVVEADADACEDARNDGFLVVDGDATDEQLVTLAGVGRAAEIASCMDSAAANLAVVLTCRDLCTEAFIVGRINHPTEERRMRLAGANDVVSPLHAGAVDAARLLVRPDVTELATNHLHVGMDLGVGEVKVEPGSRLDGLDLRQMVGHVPTLTFVVLVRPGKAPVLRPAPSAQLEADDVIVVVGTSEECQWLADAGRAEQSAA